MWTVCHGAGGNGDICSRSGLVLGPFTWQLFSNFSTSWSILGNQIFSLSSCLVFYVPWCPSWAKAKACWHNWFGMTMRVPSRTRSSERDHWFHWQSVHHGFDWIVSIQQHSPLLCQSFPLSLPNYFIRISFWSVLSSLVACLISIDIAFGVE